MTLLKRQHKNNKQAASKPHKNQVCKPFIRAYRILPHDLGFRDHLPNYRYLSFIELNIEGWLRQCLQSLPADAKAETNESGKVHWVISMQEMVYLKQVKFLDKITLSSKVEGWDSKYIYFQHHFYVKGSVRAIGLTKFLLVNDTGKLSPTLLQLHGEQLSKVIETWNTNQAAIKSQQV